MKNEWISVNERLPGGNLNSRKNEIEVIGYNEKWIHPHYNPMGQRICSIHLIENINNFEDLEWNSAEWRYLQHGYVTDRTPPTHWRPLNDSPEIIDPNQTKLDL